MQSTLGLQPGQILVGRYRLDAAIGSVGVGAGEVWRGFDLRLNRVVTLKVFAAPDATDHAGIAAFRRQAEHAAAVRHPAVEAMLDIGTGESPVFLVTEFLEGQDLKSVVGAQRGGLPVGQVGGVASQALDALAAVHAQGIVHGGLTSADLFLLGNGDVKLCNLGGVVRSAPADPRVDLYALGCVLYELLTGALPAESPPVPPASRRADVPPYLDRLVLELLAADPAARPQSAAAALATLRQSMGPAPQPTASVPPPSPAWTAVTLNDQAPPVAPTSASTPQKSGGPGRLLAEVAGAVVLVVAAAAGGYFAHGGTTGKASPARPVADKSKAPTAAPTPSGVSPKSPPLVPGWQVVVSPDFGVVYDVPPGWKVEAPDTGVGFTDASGNIPVGSNGVADIDQKGPNDSTCTIVQSGLFGGTGLTSASSGELDSLDVNAEVLQRFISVVQIVSLLCAYLLRIFASTRRFSHDQSEIR